MLDTDLAQKHAIDHQLQAIRLGAVYGALALGGLIAVHIAAGEPLGALMAIIAALFAYLNFSIVASKPESLWIGRAQMLSILWGGLSGLLVLAKALF